MLDTGNIIQGGGGVPSVDGDESTGQSNSTPIAALDSMQTASQTQFVDGSAEVLTDDEKKQQEEDVENASKLKDLIEEGLRVDCRTQPTNVLTRSQLSNKVKAMALAGLTSDRDIVIIEDYMGSRQMMSILDANAEAAAKVLNALCSAGSGASAAEILAGMNEEIAAKALLGMSDDAILEIMRFVSYRPFFSHNSSFTDKPKITFDQMASILEGNVKAAIRVLNALCLKWNKEMFSEKSEEILQKQVEQAIAILNQMSSGKGNPAEVLLGMEDDAVVKIATEKDLAFTLYGNDQATSKVLGVLCRNGKIEKAAAILLEMQRLRQGAAAEALPGMEDNDILAIAMQIPPDQMGSILGDSVKAAIKVLCALCSKEEVVGSSQEQITRAAAILGKTRNGPAAAALLKMGDDVVVEIAMQIPSDRMGNILEDNVEAAIKVLCALCLREGKEDENWRNQAKRAVDIFEKTYKREKILDDPSLVEYKDILLGITPIENDAVNSGAKRLENANPQTEHGENNEEIQSEIKSPPCTEDDTEIQSETDSMLSFENDEEILPKTKNTSSTENDKKIQLGKDEVQNSTSAKVEKSLLHSVWLRVITAVVGFGALTGIVAIVALEIAATVIPLIATLIALVLAAIAVECASFALEKRESNPKGAAK